MTPATNMQTDAIKLELDDLDRKWSSLRSQDGGGSPWIIWERMGELAYELNRRKNTQAPEGLNMENALHIPKGSLGIVLLSEEDYGAGRVRMVMNGRAVVTTITDDVILGECKTPLAMIEALERMLPALKRAAEEMGGTTTP